MTFAIVYQYPPRRLAKYISMFEDIDHKVIFNIKKFKNEKTIEQFFDPNYIHNLLSKYKTKYPIIVEVTEFISRGTRSESGIKYVTECQDLDSIQIILITNSNYPLSNNGTAKSYGIRRCDTLAASDTIYRENVCEKESVSIVFKDYEDLGFWKAVKIKSLCESCSYYDEQSYYMRCAVHPGVDNDVTYECRDYINLTSNLELPQLVFGLPAPT
jgi:hypothetical protein